METVEPVDFDFINDYVDYDFVVDHDAVEAINGLDLASKLLMADLAMVEDSMDNDLASYMYDDCQLP